LKRSFQETENPAPPHPPDTSRRLPGSDSARAQGSKAKKQAAAAAKAKKTPVRAPETHRRFVRFSWTIIIIRRFLSSERKRRCSSSN
jgi:hypothetical protein